MGLFPDVKLLVVNINLSFTSRAKKEQRKLIREQASLFLHGASGSGKTTMLERATGKSPEELQMIARTIGQESHLIKNKGEVAFVIDYGGDRVFAEKRLRTLNELRPLAILLLLDHAPRGKETDEDYRCPPKGKLPEDESHPIRLRFEQHKRAINELTWIFSTSPTVGERCRLVLPIVNKRDAWENMGYTIHIFTDWYFDVLTELTSTLAINKVKWHRPVPLAGKWEGFGSTLDIVAEIAGKETVVKLAENPFFTAIARFPKNKKSF